MIPSIETSAKLEQLLELEALRSFFTREAVLLDSWQLTEWAALFAEEACYLIEPMGDDVSEDHHPDRDYYVVADDRSRIDQRVQRLGKVTAHAEYPHSLTRHLFTNIRLVSRVGDEIKAELDFLTVRTRRQGSQQFVGTSRYVLSPGGVGKFRIHRKSVYLAHETLFDQGKVSIIL